MSESCQEQTLRLLLGQRIRDGIRPWIFGVSGFESPVAYRISSPHADNRREAHRYVDEVRA
jgi:hypothetical protein